MSAPASRPTIDEQAGHCFGCGPSNPEGLHLQFTVDATDPEAITATAVATLTRLHEGPPGHIHGGIIATLMDEAMSKLNRGLDVLAMTRQLTVEYLRPAPTGQPLTLTAMHLRRDGRKLHHSAQLADATGRVLATATGFFIVVNAADFPPVPGANGPAKLDVPAH